MSTTTSSTTNTTTIAVQKRNPVTHILSRYGVLILLILLIAGFSVWQQDRFFTLGNFAAILTGQAIPLIIAIAVIFPLAAGEFDLSVAANLSFIAIWVAWTSASGWPLALVFVSAIVLGALIGAINAFFVVKVGINAFIATLAMSTILVGMNLLVTNGQLLFRGIPAELKTVALSNFVGLPLIVWYSLIICVVAWYVLEYTPFGRYIRATGSGRIAARLSGVRTAPTLSYTFIIAGALAGLAGFLLTSRIGSANPASGPEFLLPAYAAAFLGATVIQQGLFNVWGTVIGALVLAVGITGLTLAGAPFWLPYVFNGVALLLAVSLSVLSTRKREGR